MTIAKQAIADALFCDLGIGENIGPDSDTNESDRVAAEIIDELPRGTTVIDVSTIGELLVIATDDGVYSYRAGGKLKKVTSP